MGWSSVEGRTGGYAKAVRQTWPQGWGAKAPEAGRYPRGLELTSRFGLPEAGAQSRAAPVQAEMDVIAVGGRVVHLLLAALPVVADRVGLEAAVAGVPALAVPDDLLDAHAARERVHVAELVGREQQVDDALRLTLLPRIVHVEVPVDRAALRVEARGVLAPLLAAHDSP